MSVEEEILALAKFCGAEAAAVSVVAYRGAGERSACKGWRTARVTRLAPWTKSVASVRDDYGRSLDLIASGATDAGALDALRAYVRDLAASVVEAIERDAKRHDARAAALREQAADHDSDAAELRAKHARRSEELARLTNAGAP